MKNTSGSLKHSQKELCFLLEELVFIGLIKATLVSYGHFKLLAKNGRRYGESFLCSLGKGQQRIRLMNY